MTLDTGPWWLRWLPADSRAGVQRRALIVWGVAAAIALLQTFVNPAQHPLDRSLVYSYGISTSIWFLADPMRIVLRRWLGVDAPHYWTFNARSVLLQVIAILLGYSAGTAIGDAYTGQSTWQLLWLSPQRFWGFLLWSVGISGGFLFFFYHREKAHALERQATEARLKLLETQLEPHMLFNTLANLRALIATDPPRAIGMLDRLNDYLRATLRASRTDSASSAHTLTHEFARVRDYLELMAVRMGPRMAYALNLPDTLAQHPVPPLLLQPLVENAIRHGLEPQLDGGRITVSASAEGSSLILEVIDTGVGMNPGAAPGGSGFGLAQVRERVASLPDGRVDVQSALGQGTTVRIRLPLNNAP
jgi:signal transduction histidine kinase